MPRYLSKFGLDGVLKLLKVMRADVLAQSPEYRYRLDQIADAEEIAKNLAAQKPCLSLRELQIRSWISASRRAESSARCSPNYSTK